MNQKIIPGLAAAFLLGLLSAYAADESESSEHKHVIVLKTDDSELQETEISHLAVGDVETFVTENGQTVALLRTEDGVEIYIDGELLDPHADSGLHGGDGVIHKRVELICEDDEMCEKSVWVSDDADIDLDVLHDVGHEVIRVHEGDDDRDETIETVPGEREEKFIIIREKNKAG